MPAERSDAARNRERILRAAAELFDREGVAPVSMARIAEAAGVGKGTVFRRFTDRTGLIEAILEPRVARLRTALTEGPPPLGPGAEPAKAFAAILDALFEFAWENRALNRAFEHLGPDAYYANPVCQFWIAELRARIAAVNPDIDADYFAHALFTAMRADIMDYLLSARGMDKDRIRAGIEHLAGSVQR